ncbi:MAG: LytR family transcriptional regulator [Ilumatobacteraceae bacterium]|nr:LytR family transcriptional regulator [Ilumatobacteraceae bacterium]
MNQPKSRGTRSSLSIPNNATLGAVVAVVAVILGFLILKSVSNDNGGSSIASPAATVAPETTVDPAMPPVVTVAPLTAFKVQIANASGVAGSAGKLTLEMQSLGYVTQPALNVAPGTPKRNKTGVFYLAGCEANAQNVAERLGGSPEVGAMPTPVPLETGTLREACVLILLGTDLAGKTIPGATSVGNGTATTDTTTTVTG